MERIIDRLTQYMSRKGINDNQMTKLAGLSVGLLGNARSGSRDLGKKAVEKILAVCPDLDRVWLVTGMERMPDGCLTLCVTGTDTLEDRRRELFDYLISSLLDRGVKKSGIAERLGYSPQRLTNLLNGMNAVSDNVLVNLVSAFNLGRISLVFEAARDFADGTFPVSGDGLMTATAQSSDKVVVDRDEYNYLRGVKESLDVIRKSCAFVSDYEQRKADRLAAEFIEKHRSDIEDRKG